MEEVTESMKFINEKFEEMEADSKEKERQISELKRSKIFKWKDRKNG